MEFYGVLYTNCHFIEGKYFFIDFILLFAFII